MTDLASLIARLEAAEGPSRELDALIAVALDIRAHWMKGDPAPLIAERDGVVRLGKRGPGYEPCRFTASLDSALSLVPEGPRWWWTVNFVEGAYGAIITHYKTDDPADGWLFHEHAEGAAPALALCLAALKARAQG